MRKLIILSAFLVSMAPMANAQIESGKYAIGGSLGLAFDPTDIQVQPRFGYFLTENWAVGLNMNLRFQENVALDEMQTTFDLAPIVRYYYPLADKLYLFGHAQVNLNNIAGPGAFNFNIGAYPGVAYFINEQFAIEGGLNALGGGGLGVFLLF